jgi:hypothetical protein
LSEGKAGGGMMGRRSVGPRGHSAHPGIDGAARWPGRLQRWLIAVLVATSMIAANAACGAPNGAGSAAALRAEYAAVSDGLAVSPFQRPLRVESQEKASELRGDVRAVVDHPFATVSSALGDAAHWCDILILHLNVKYCRASDAAGGSLAVEIGRKNGEALDASRRVTLAHRVVTSSGDYVRIVLAAERGPFSTANYTIMLEAIPLEGGKSFLHLSYSHAFGLRAKLAMRAYFSTLGAGKVGFSVVATDAAGKPVYVNDLRGALERNAMRFYLAIDAYLDAMSAPPEEQPDLRMRQWFAATERFPLQLRELDQAEYLAMKREEYQRQQLAP